MSENFRVSSYHFFGCKRETFTTSPDTGVVLVVSRVSRFSPDNFRPYFSRTVREPAGFLRGQSRVRDNFYLYKQKFFERRFPYFG